MASLAGFLFAQCIGCLGHRLEALFRNRMIADIRYSITSLLDFLQRTLHLCKPSYIAGYQIALPFQGVELLRVILVFMRL